MDAVIPMVFPDYKIRVVDDIPPQKIDIIPGFTFDNFTTPKISGKISDLGHAGVLFINGNNGVTKYYEYGRYDKENLGMVRKVSMPDVKVKNKAIILSSLKPVFASISKKAGQNGKIHGIYIEVENKFQSMLIYAKNRMSQNHNKKRKKYDLLSNSCVHFSIDVANIAGANIPNVIDPRPTSKMNSFREDFLDISYYKGTLEIESKGKF